ncbi:MBL fold metallo-hydrolase [Candidatus Peregrinibacteria bacterium]|jgi:competence protein ComEC|nr:MBL fold metallo-hydrolase [Candidatus Peregrinibacteria bacterium]MBT7737068.1 MBL fold metallo-hydrolase [Candidatus Peregrinibacteria bacterium]
MPSSSFFKYLGLITVFATAALILLWKELPDEQLHVFFLNVGQGDSTFIVTPENHQILIDGGPKNNVLTELDAVIPYYDQTIDMLILTHPDADHVDGFAEVVKRYQVENILLTAIENSNPAYQELLKEIYNQDINIIIAQSGIDFKLGEVVIDVLHPIESIEGAHFETPNDSSIVLKLFYKGNRILLTGDIEKEGEVELIGGNSDIEADVLKVAHHGSKTSSTIEFLKLVSPSYAIIQSEKDNKFGHPNVETLDALIKVGVQKIFRNDQLGRIEFVF